MLNVSAALLWTTCKTGTVFSGNVILRQLGLQLSSLPNGEKRDLSFTSENFVGH